MKITRRDAIITSLMALAGTHVYAKQNDEAWKGTFSTATGTLNTTEAPMGVEIHLDQVAYLEVSKGGKKVRIETQEIWDALNPNTEATHVKP